MDTPLAAIKRAARAVLKDELKALRAEVRALIRENVNVHINADNAVDEARMDRDNAINAHDRALVLLNGYRHRTEQVHAWQAVNRKGDFTVRACAEYIEQGPNPLVHGAGALHMNPFDRWQVSPPIR